MDEQEERLMENLNGISESFQGFNKSMGPSIYLI